MANPFVHVELNTSNVGRAKEFYGALFGWKLEEMPGMDYTMISVGEGTGGGMMKNPVPGAPDLWLPYVLVDDVQAATRTAATLGGRVLKEIAEVPKMGLFSVVADPTGAPFGLWQPTTEA